MGNPDLDIKKGKLSLQQVNCTLKHCDNLLAVETASSFTTTQGPQVSSQFHSVQEQ